jgi:hypothetical protein
MITEEEKKQIEEFDEAKLYFLIDMIGGIIWRTQHDIGHGRYTMTPEMHKGLEEISEKQKFCLQQLQKFGVDPKSADDRPNGDYWKWFEHWHDWHHKMSDENWKKLDRRMNAEEDYTDLLPKCKWNEKQE